MRQKLLLKRGIEVFGGKDRFFMWMKTPVYSLGYRTPAQVAITPRGFKDVLWVLAAIEYGLGA